MATIFWMIISFLLGAGGMLVGAIIWAKSHKKKVEKALTLLYTDAKLEDLKNDALAKAKEEIKEAGGELAEEIAEWKEDPKREIEQLKAKIVETVEDLKEKIKVFM